MVLLLWYEQHHATRPKVHHLELGRSVAKHVLANKNVHGSRVSHSFLSSENRKLKADRDSLMDTKCAGIHILYRSWSKAFKAYPRYHPSSYPETWEHRCKNTFWMTSKLWLRIISFIRLSNFIVLISHLSNRVCYHNTITTRVFCIMYFIWKCINTTCIVDFREDICSIQTHVQCVSICVCVCVDLLMCVSVLWL